MKLDHLVLKNFRNYAAVDTTFSPEINVLIGANA
ncbi:DNA replication and repair protein recF, partial [Lacticaseibacillus paracasei subsp. paracasei Lpp41]